MADPALAVRSALIAALKTALGITRVYDEVPSTRSYPYVALGPTQTIPDEEADDPSCGAGSEVFQQIDAWSSDLSLVTVGTMAGTIRTALRTPLTVAGHVVVLQEVEDHELTRDPTSGHTRARISLRLLTEPA